MEKNIVANIAAKRTKSRIYLFFKRVFDIFSSSVAMVVLSPVFLIIAILIKKEDNGPIFYNHKRVGQYGKDLVIYKFRSMMTEENQAKVVLTPEQIEQYKKEYKIDNDPRITKVGKILRKTSLDELPQLLNILKGQLSVVGPRPIVKDELSKYTDSQRKKFLSVKPGLTGYWQAYARNNATYESGIRQRMEIHYVDNASFGFDLKIIFKTVVSVIKKTGAK